jgi:hypothetical protein
MYEEIQDITNTMSRLAVSIIEAERGGDRLIQ